MASLFTPDGLRSWQMHLNRSDRFRDAASGWFGTLLLLEQEPDGDARSTWVRVADGACTEVRVGAAADHEAADFILAASATTWESLVTARMTPVAAAITGRLKLLRGDVLALAPHAKAAAELLAAAGDPSA